MRQVQGTGRAPVPGAAYADERLREIIARLGDGIVIVDQTGTVRFANPAAEALFGRAAAELVGHELGFPLAAGETTEIDVIRPGGKPAAAELVVVETSWEGRPAYLVSLRDVTLRREAEERARQVERERRAREGAEAEARRSRFLSEVSAVLAGSLDVRTTLDALAHLAVPYLADWCVIDVLEGGRIERVAGVHSDAASAALLEELRERFPPEPGGTSPAALAIRSEEPVFLPEVTAPVLGAHARDPEHAALLERLGMRSVIAVPLVARARSLGAATFVRGAERYGEADLALARDFAQRAALAVSNARLYEEAQQASRAKSEFLAVMSHELRTPLNAVIGYTDLLAAEVSGPLNDLQKTQLARTKTSAVHLLQLVDEILTYSRMEAGVEETHHERFDLRPVVRENVEALEPLATQKGLELRMELPTEPTVVEADAAKVGQILRNLVSNAVKFTDRGSVTVQAVPDGVYHLVRVRDTGMGIAPEHLERIFEPFWQVEQSNRREVGGTGLGLSVARGLAGLLGGDVRVDSAPGAGSTFTLALPKAD